MCTMMTSWINFDDPSVSLVNASFAFHHVAAAGEPARPLAFPTPVVHQANRIVTTAVDHRRGHSQKVSLLMKAGTNTNRAFLFKRKLRKSTFGDIRTCVVMRRRQQRNGSGKALDIQWETTDQMAVVKIAAWSKMERLVGRCVQDPVTEVSALQLVGNYNKNVLGVLEVLQDETQLYTIMPFCSRGDLLGKISDAVGDSDSSNGSETTMSDPDRPIREFHRVDEPHARHWFRQILSGLLHLQRKGVCHRNISLDNLLIGEDGYLKIIDFSMALRVPYSDPNSYYDHVTDASEGTMRRLMRSYGLSGGKLMYVAPEIVARTKAIDGFAVDLWSAGIVLFVLLVGHAPFKVAHESDLRFARVAEGCLKELLFMAGISLSDEAYDLLQRMLTPDPGARLSLSQVMHHPWVVGMKFYMPAPPTTVVETRSTTSSTATPSKPQYWSRGVPPTQRAE